MWAFESLSRRYSSQRSTLIEVERGSYNLGAKEDAKVASVVKSMDIYMWGGYQETHWYRSALEVSTQHPAKKHPLVTNSGSRYQDRLLVVNQCKQILASANKLMGLCPHVHRSAMEWRLWPHSWEPAVSEGVASCYA